MPPMVELPPGSTEKNRPVSRRCSLSCSWVTPACTVASRSPVLTCKIRCICERSRHTPPRNATTLPSKPVPLPKGISGTLCCAQILTISLTCSVDCAKATASGGTQGCRNVRCVKKGKHQEWHAIVLRRHRKVFWSLTDLSYALGQTYE